MPNLADRDESALTSFPRPLNNYIAAWLVWEVQSGADNQGCEKIVRKNAP